MDQYGLAENKDYNLLNVEQPVKQGGVSTKKIYTLTPYAFKICLIRAKNSKVYANYYLLLEEIYSLYTDYERLYAEKLLSMKDDKIDKLQSDVNELLLTNRQQSAEINQLLGYAKDTKATLDDVQEDLTETKEQVYIAKTYLKQKSFQSTKNPTDESKHHYFAVLHFTNNNQEFVKFISGQKASKR